MVLPKITVDERDDSFYDIPLIGYPVRILREDIIFQRSMR
jgi:hypothetical protein